MFSNELELRFLPLQLRFHTNSTNIAVSNDDRTCALCLNIMEQANIKKICNSCMSKHNFSMNIGSKGQQQLCNLCQKKFEPGKLQDHLIEHEMENGSVSCAICCSIFTSVAGLKDHIRDHNLTALDLKEVCSKCNSRFLYHSELLQHLHEHESVENQTKSIKVESVGSEVIKDIKEEEEDEIDIEKVAEV